MLAVGIAMDKTGAARLIVESLAIAMGALGPVAALSAVYFLTSALTEIMSNNASAILLTPISAGLAVQLGVDPRPFVVAVMFAASASFATPIGHQPTPFVSASGRHRFLSLVKTVSPQHSLHRVSST